MTRHDDTTPEQFAADRLDIPLADLPDEEIVFVGVADGNDGANRPPTVDIVASARTGDEVGLAADATDPDGSIQSYEWQIDGEVVSTARTLDTQFDDSGKKKVSVTVTDDEGAKGSATLQVSVEGEPELPRRPLSIEGTNSPVLEGETMWVTALVENNGSEAIEPSIQGVVEPTDGSGSPLGAGTKTKQPTLDPGGAACLTFTWETGPGDGGTYEATVSTGDGDGGTTSDSQTVEISAAPNASPTVDIIAETTSSVIGEQVAFAAEATDPDGSISTYEWRVDGESVSSSGALLTQAFGEDGERTVAVTVTDDEGATDTSY
ncbi:MAG: PKD domain-containing protein [Halobacteriales archaeon]